MVAAIAPSLWPLLKIHPWVLFSQQTQPLQLISQEAKESSDYHRIFTRTYSTFFPLLLKSLCLYIPNPMLHIESQGKRCVYMQWITVTGESWYSWVKLIIWYSFHWILRLRQFIWAGISTVEWLMLIIINFFFKH